MPKPSRDKLELAAIEATLSALAELEGDNVAASIHCMRAIAVTVATSDIDPVLVIVEYDRLRAAKVELTPEMEADRDHVAACSPIEPFNERDFPEEIRAARGDR